MIEHCLRRGATTTSGYADRPLTRVSLIGHGPERGKNVLVSSVKPRPRGGSPISRVRRASFTLTAYMPAQHSVSSLEYNLNYAYNRVAGGDADGEFDSWLDMWSETAFASMPSASSCSTAEGRRCEGLPLEELFLLPLVPDAVAGARCEASGAGAD